ncbi:MAG: right-handed parallel beta-helix repeat-containing protein, partial [Bacteroidota bacterium]
VEKDMIFFKENDTRRLQQLHHEFQPFMLMDLGRTPLLDPVFRWTRIPNDKKIGLRYDLYISRDPKFDEKATTVIKAIEDTFHMPESPLEKGTWYYKVVARKGSLYLTGYGRHFKVIIDKANEIKASGNTIRLEKAGSPYRISNDLEIAGSGMMSIEAGTTLYIDSGINLRIKGKLVCIGDSANRIALRSSVGHAGWGILELNGCSSPTAISSTDISNGRLVYHNCEVSLRDVRFTNHASDLDKLEGRPSLVWGQNGKFTMDRCVMSGNSTGEGINLHGGWPRIMNSVFVRVPDAIEFISADSGLIVGNDIGYSKDDGIDLNDCRNIRITNNYIHDNFDKAVSAGVDHHGSSHGISMTGNIFFKNAYGCDIKDSSDATVSENIMYSHRYGVLARQKEPGYQVGGNVDAIANIILPLNGGTVFKTEGKSVIRQNGNFSNVATEKGTIIDSSFFYSLDETPFYPCKRKSWKELSSMLLSIEINLIDSDIFIINLGIIPVDIGRSKLVSSEKETMHLPAGTLLMPGDRLIIYRNKSTLPKDWEHGMYLKSTLGEKIKKITLSDVSGNIIAVSKP